jgi:hypothetical protein
MTLKKDGITQVNTGGGGSSIVITDGGVAGEAEVINSIPVGTEYGLVVRPIDGGGGGPATIADGADVAEGATTDAAVITDTTGTLSAKLRGLIKWAFERMPASLGQKVMSASLPVTIASNQSSLSVTETEIRVTNAIEFFVPDQATAVQLIDVDITGFRRGISIVNDSSADLYIRCGGVASLVNYTARIIKNGYWESPFRYAGDVSGIWTSDPNDGAARITEFQV